MPPQAPRSRTSYFYKQDKKIEQGILKIQGEREEREISGDIQARSEGNVPPHRLRDPLHLPPERRVAHHARGVAELAGGLFLFWILKREGGGM